MKQGTCLVFWRPAFKDYASAMPRPARIAPKGRVYYVLNRAPGRMGMLRRDFDFATFERVMIEAHERMPLRILSWCVMSNQWHFVVRPTTDSQVTNFFPLVDAHACDALAHTVRLEGRPKGLW